MFGNNKDQINKLIEVSNQHVKNIETLRELFESMQNQMIKMAKVQAQHKVIISFLINHATVDEEAKDDLGKMMQEIIKLEKDD